MFKLLKSKKGFTLVELMIVVVIMAILVAVAVPIFSAVTKNARTKTCLANQREIQAQLNNNSMSGILTLEVGDEFVLTTNAAGDNGTWSGGSADQLKVIKDLFQKVPYCPVKGNTITVTVAAADLGANNEAESFKITTVCGGSDETHN